MKRINSNFSQASLCPSEGTPQPMGVHVTTAHDGRKAIVNDAVAVMAGTYGGFVVISLRSVRMPGDHDIGLVSQLTPEDAEKFAAGLCRAAEQLRQQAAADAAALIERARSGNAS